MCRWFAYISPTEPCLLADVLVKAKHSLSNQVHDHYLPYLLAHDHTISQEHDMKARNMLFNVDGLGVAWYTSSDADFEHGNTDDSGDGIKKEGLRPAVYRTIQPPSNDINFRSICTNTESRVVFGHIRAASATAITIVNNHPFIFGRHCFMHNGAASDFIPIRLALCQQLSKAAFANIHGSTDSEHIAALYITYLTHGGDENSWEQEYSLEDMAAALQKAVATIVQLQVQILGENKRPNSLNLCATDGIKLVACRFRNHATSQPPSLYYSTKAGVTLNRKYPDHPDGTSVSSRGKLDESEHGTHLIVASEPSTYKEHDWALIGKNQCLKCDADGKFELINMQYQKGWDAEDAA